MQITKSRIYSIALPDWQALESHLQAHLHKEILPDQSVACGFALSPTIPSAYAYAHGFHGFVAICLQIDEKVLPAGAVNEAVRKEVARIESEDDRSVGRKERKEVKEYITAQLCRTALVSTTYVTAFYCPQSQFLFVPASKKHADYFTSALVHAVGAAKTSTINVSNIKGGLTTRVMATLNQDDNQFDPFELSSGVWLKGETGAIAMQVDEPLSTASRGIVEAIEEGYEVHAARLYHRTTGISFKIDSNFILSKIQHPDTDDADTDEQDAAAKWDDETAIECAHMVLVAKDLCTLFDYKPEPTEAEPEAEAVA